MGGYDCLAVNNMARNAGKLLVTPGLLLAWLDYGGGTITSIELADGIIEIVVAHPDMPVQEDGQDAEIVSPVYRYDEGKESHRLRSGEV